MSAETRVDVCEGKYTFVMADNGTEFYCLRHGEAWMPDFHCVQGSRATFAAVSDLDEARKELAKLRQQVEHLESLRPHWAKGYSSDGVAAQCATDALNQLWKLLGVSHQTAAVEALKRLQAFKDYVHQRLDEAGVPADPDSPHKAAGCRVGGRLDVVLGALSAAESAAAEPVAWASDELLLASLDADERTVQVGNCEMTPFHIPLYLAPPKRSVS